MFIELRKRRRNRLRHHGNYAILDLMSSANILTEEFAQPAAAAGLRARRNALAAGHPVVFVDDLGRYVEEWPNGKQIEIRLQPGNPRESHLQILGEIATPAL
jgi:hypothetical protein